MNDHDNLRGCKGQMIGLAVGVLIWALIIAGISYGCHRGETKTIKTEQTK